MKSKELVIRSMEDKDLDGVHQVEESCFSSPWTRYMFEDELYNLNAHYLVIKIDSKIIGYVGFWKILDEGHITNVAIHPDYRKLGYGKALIAALIQKAREPDIIALTLEVRVSNAPAIALYESFGFVISGCRKKYYQDNNEDALIMWLRL